MEMKKDAFAHARRACRFPIWLTAILVILWISADGMAGGVERDWKKLLDFVVEDTEAVLVLHEEEFVCQKLVRLQQFMEGRKDGGRLPITVSPSIALKRVKNGDYQVQNIPIIELLKYLPEMFGVKARVVVSDTEIAIVAMDDIIRQPRDDE